MYLELFLLLVDGRDGVEVLAHALVESLRLEHLGRDALDGRGEDDRREAAPVQEQQDLIARLQVLLDRGDLLVVPVRDIAGLMMLDRDETIRDNASLEAMARLEPSFAKVL